MSEPTQNPDATGSPAAAPAAEAGDRRVDEIGNGGADTPAEAPPGCPVVGIGASAGGLEAYRRLVEHLPTDTGMAFVLVQHLDPQHRSLLAELIGSATRMPVAEATDGLAVEPNHLYTIPPNVTLGILHGRLQILERITERGRHLPVDDFLRSLAQDQGDQAIGVVLSGTASDGTAGLAAIKAAGGLTLVQDQESSAYWGMPGSAVAAGCADLVLPPEEIAQELARMARHPLLRQRLLADEPLSGDAATNALSKIYLLLRSRSGNDFALYKQTTIRRRIRRRMLVHKLERLADYVRFLQGNPAELDALFQDMLIQVTSFFRDPDAFATLRAKVLPRVFAAYRARAVAQPEFPNQVRVWVPACSTGEEAYSLAMTLLEYLGEEAGAQAVPPAIATIQVFATDIDEQAIATARRGVYPERIAAEVSAERLRRFFVKVSGGYQVSKALRDLCIFAVQNVVKDPPFSRLDLVSCRNLLIYFGPVLQKRVLQVFHYALEPTGFLMLGPSETIGHQADLFALVDQPSKIYGKKSVAGRLGYEFTPRTPVQDGLAEPPLPKPRGLGRHPQQEADDLILARYSPPGVIVSTDLEILHFRGQVGRYLDPTPGAASLNLLKMAGRRLFVALRAALAQAQQSGAAVRMPAVAYERDGGEGVVDIQVLPLHTPVNGEPCLLVLFEETGSAPSVAPAAGQGAARVGGDDYIATLERELASNRDYLQAAIAEQEGTNEELRSLNEEIQSANEELQSTNEELETAKEELQSTNEELVTVNDELEHRNAALATANNDITNMLSSINLPILMLDNELRIRQFTPQAERLLNLIAADLGRPIGNIKPNIEVPHLEALVRRVIDRLSVETMELQDNAGHWYAVRVRPYKTLDHRIDGAVITFMEIDEIKEAERLRTALTEERRLVVLVRDAMDAMTVQEFDGRILAWNPAAVRVYGYTEGEALSLNIRQLIPDAALADYELMLAQLRAAGEPSAGRPLEPYRTRRSTQDGRELEVSLVATLLLDRDGQPYALGTTERVLGAAGG
ncbi:chemotaxis protein CheB [uncultured Thiodictyon sp.]|uniref:chemotaxis protein CheB n=1 Tax=uncultured Thiodictyon sp. TaxID=1846217 RepID=UPI0025ED2882|nr:chemotaxis protein CheB [uncultured Thiodictyon sp.]